MLHIAVIKSRPMTRKPYEKRTDLEKCQSQWWKLTGLQNREEWSAAIVPATEAVLPDVSQAQRTTTLHPVRSAPRKSTARSRAESG